jgi:putative hemolysin
MLVAESHEAGVIDAHERDMMNRVMRLGDRTADSLMTPRNRIAWLDTQAGLERNLEIMAEHEFSRYPVYRDNDMDVVGVLELKWPRAWRAATTRCSRPCANRCTSPNRPMR